MNASAGALATPQTNRVKSNTIVLKDSSLQESIRSVLGDFDYLPDQKGDFKTSQGGNSWVIFHDDCIGANFGSYKTGLKYTWFASGVPGSDAEKQAMASRRNDAYQLQEDKYNEIALEVHDKLEYLEPAKSDDPYPQSKGITPYG